MLRVAVCTGRAPALGALQRALCLRPWLPLLPPASRAPSGAGPEGQVSVQAVRFVRFSSTSSAPGDLEGDRLVYIGNLGTAVLGVKFFSYSTSMISLIILPLLLTESGIGVDSLPLKIAFYSVVGFFTFITPVTLHYVTKRYVVRLYYNQEKDLYTAITYSALLKEKSTEFSPDDVEVPDISKMFTTFYAKKKSMLINPLLFPISDDYQHLMGYDKPFTFNPEEVDPPTKVK